MRILHVISTTNPAYGGPVESVSQLGSYLKGQGVRVEVAACCDAPASGWLQSYPLQVHAMGPGWGRYGFSPRLVPWLRRNGRDYDAWVINGIWQYHASAAAHVARDIGVPYVVYTHGMLDPWSRRAHPVKYLKKFAYWMLTERRTLADAFAVCFTAEEERQLSHRYFPVGSWTDCVVGAGISNPETGRAKDEAIDRFPMLRDKRVLLFLGRIHAKKGIDILLRSFHQLSELEPSLHLLVVGEGERRYTSQLRKLCDQLQLAERVTFTGALYGERKWAAFAASELFVLPSHQENFGIAVAEALACGVPVCISSKVNIWREIRSDGGGLVCDDDDASLTAELTRWIRLPAEARNEFRTRARECFERRFHIASAAGRFLDLLGAATRGGVGTLSGQPAHPLL